MNEKTLKRNNKHNHNFKRQGLFITIEGPEGSGKSTQAAMLSEWLANMGVPFLMTREPGDGKIGSQIRGVILNADNKEMTAKAETFLYAADRAQHVECVLKPALEKNLVIICDRYVDSHLAYQGYGRGLDLDFLREINQMATGGLTPDLTILLNLPAETGLARVKQRELFAKGNNISDCGIDRMEQEKIDFHRRLCKGYLEIAAAEPNRVMVIDAEQDINDIKYEIRRMISGLLLLRGFINETNLHNEFFDIG